MNIVFVRIVGNFSTVAAYFISVGAHWYEYGIVWFGMLCVYYSQSSVQSRVIYIRVVIIM